jgi:hypothetical protein
MGLCTNLSRTKEDFEMKTLPPPRKPTCSECSHWVPMRDAHLDWQNEPILGGCEYNKYETMRRAVCCENFKNKP